MSSLSIFAPGGAGQIGQFGVNGNDREIGANHEEVELAASSLALPGF